MVTIGQYHLTINLDKRQFLHPHRFGDGLKLLEFGLSSMGTMAGLAILLADSNGRGGGDLRSKHPLIGSWAGDRIVVAGDYADPGKWLEDEDEATIAALLDAVLVEEPDYFYHEHADKYRQIRADEGDHAAFKAAFNLFSYVLRPESGFEDISIDTIVALADDDYFRAEWEKRLGPDGWYNPEWAAEYRRKRNEWASWQAVPRS